MKRKTLATLLTICMTTVMLPISVAAEENISNDYSVSVDAQANKYDVNYCMEKIENSISISGNYTRQFLADSIRMDESPDGPPFGDHQEVCIVDSDCTVTINWDNDLLKDDANGIAYLFCFPIDKKGDVLSTEGQSNYEQTGYVESDMLPHLDTFKIGEYLTNNKNAGCNTYCLNVIYDGDYGYYEKDLLFILREDAGLFNLQENFNSHIHNETKVTVKPTWTYGGLASCFCPCGWTYELSIPALTSADKPSTNISVTASNLKLKTGQKTTACEVTNITPGDAVSTVKSSNTKIVKVSDVDGAGTFKLTAGKKTGTAKITITMYSGLRKTVTVKVQKNTVKTSKLSVKSKKVTLNKGKTANLGVKVSPITSQEKVTYTSSNKKVAKVTSKGVVKGVKKGTAKITAKSGKKKVTVTVTVK